MITEIKNEEIRLYENNLKELFSWFPYGISDFYITSNVSYYKTVEKYYTNEVTLVFNDGFFKSIELNFWKKVEDILMQLKYEKQIEGFFIHTDSNKVVIDLSQDFSLGVY
jgi:hypothetical protein